MPIHDTDKIAMAISLASSLALSRRNEFLTPEHMLAALLKDDDVRAAISQCCDIDHLEAQIKNYMDSLEEMPDGNYELNASSQLQELIAIAENAARGSGSTVMKVHHLMYAFFQLEESYARFALEDTIETSVPALLNNLVQIEDESNEEMPQGERWTRFFRECPAEEIVGHFQGVSPFLQFDEAGERVQRQHGFCHGDEEQIGNLIPVIKLFHRTFDQSLLHIVADHGRRDGNALERSQAICHILSGLFQIEPHIGDLMKARETKRAHGAGKLVSDILIHDFISFVSLFAAQI